MQCLEEFIRSCRSHKFHISTIFKLDYKSCDKDTEKIFFTIVSDPNPRSLYSKLCDNLSNRYNNFTKSSSDKPYSPVCSFFGAKTSSMIPIKYTFVCSSTK